ARADRDRSRLRRSAFGLLRLRIDLMLLDTHVLLWFLAGESKRVSAQLRSEIEAGPAIVSVASLWEIAIKRDLGKLTAPDDLPERIGSSGFELLAVEAEHAWTVQGLPHHHRDP